MFMLIPEGVAEIGSGLEKHILRHDARVNDHPINIDVLDSKKDHDYGAISLFEDIQISEEISIDRFKHQFSALSLMSEGRVLAGWEDNRNGDFDIFGQVVSPDGLTSGPDNLLVSDNDFLSDQMIDFAFSSDGFIIAVWVNESGNLMLRAYDSTFAPLIDVKQVNDNIGENVTSFPDAAFLSDGRVVVVWEDTRLESAIFGQIYNTDLSASGPNFQVSPDDPGKFFWSPRVAAGTSGQFAVVWEEISISGSNVFLLLYDSEALPTGIPINVADLANQADNQFGPAMASLGAEGYLVGWSDSRDGDQNIFSQILDGNGNKIESNVPVSEGTGNEAFDLYFAQNPGGILMAVWANIGVRFEIFAQVFDAAGKISGGNFTVSDGLVLGERFSPNAVFRTDGSVFISFTDTRSAFLDIYGQILNSDFSLSGSNFKLTTGATGAQQVHSDIVRMAGDDFGVVWTDMRNDDGDIFFQRGDGFGSPYGSNMKINDDVGKVLQDDPSIGSATNGLAIVSWVDGRLSVGLTGINIFGQWIGASGQKIGSNFLVNDDPTGSAVLQAEPDCDIAPSGKTVIVWRDRRNGVDDIFAQLYDGSGSPLGMNFQVNQETLPCSNPRVAVANDESFLIAWLYETEAKTYIKFQPYSTEGTPVGDNMLIPVDTSVNQQIGFDLSVNPYFGFYVLAWINQNNSDREINAVIITAAGVPVPQDIVVTSDMANLGFEDVSVDMDVDNSYVVAWSDMRSGARRSYLSFIEEGTTVHPYQLISQTGSAREQEPAIAINGRTWFASWSDNRNAGQGYDIFANSNLYNPTSAEDETGAPVPDQFTLSQNYPNPFNPVTRIDFSLPWDTDEVNFDVYNILGRRVHAETMKDMSAGSYTIEFSGEGLPSGIYLYRLRADDKILTRKMSLLK
jgi:hypothetical protein